MNKNAPKTPISQSVTVRLVVVILTLTVVAFAIGFALNHSIEYYRTCRRKAVELSDTGLMTVLSRLHEQPENLESVPVTTSANGWYRVTIEPDTTRRDSMQIHLETIGHYGMVTHKKKYRFRMTITENETVWVQTYVE